MPKMKARKDQLSEKNMSAADRLAFWGAKKKELESFFQNDVWTYDDAENARRGRTLKGHFRMSQVHHPGVQGPRRTGRQD